MRTYVRDDPVLLMPRESNTIESLGDEPPSVTVTPRAVFSGTLLDTLMFVPSGWLTVVQIVLLTMWNCDDCDWRIAAARAVAR